MFQLRYVGDADIELNISTVKPLLNAGSRINAGSQINARVI